MSNNIDASLVILTYKRKALMILRDNKPEIVSPNCWCFPGGTKELNESFEESCKREIFEELSINIGRLIYITTLLYEDRRKYFYSAKLSENQLKDIKLTEGQKYDFFTLQEIEKLPLARSTKMLVDQQKDTLERLLLEE